MWLFLSMICVCVCAAAFFLISIQNTSLSFFDLYINKDNNGDEPCKQIYIEKEEGEVHVQYAVNFPSWATKVSTLPKLLKTLEQE